MSDGSSDVCSSDLDVPLVALRIQLRIIGPVVLAMHHVVADLHVLDDLGVRECGDTDDERDRIEAKANHRATGNRAAASTTDHVTDEIGIASCMARGCRYV